MFDRSCLVLLEAARQLTLLDLEWIIAISFLSGGLRHMPERLRKEQQRQSSEPQDVCLAYLFCLSLFLGVSNNRISEGCDYYHYR